MRLSPLAIGPVLAGCVLIAVTSCSTDEQQTEAGLGPSVSLAAAAVSAYDIVKVPSMTIDGNLSEWSSVAAISMADDPGNGRGALNNSASVKLAWNDTYLYAAYNVTDTELLGVQTTRDHADLYRDDAIELYLDPQGDGAAMTSMTTTDYQLLANVRDALGDSRGTGTPSKDDTFNPASFLAKAVTNGTLNAAGADIGYTVEIRIAWTDLGVTPAAGNFMRVDLAVDDDDTANTTTQEFDWAGLSGYNNPSGWRDVQLVNPPPPTSAYDIIKVGSMTVDGNLSDWAGVAAISMADDPANGRGSLNNSATVKLAWNDTYLYTAYNVSDTELLAVQTARDASALYKDDEVELYVDPQGDGAAATSMTATDYQFLASVLETVGDYKGNGAGGKDVNFNAASFLAKAIATGTVNASGADAGYTVETRIAWSDLGVTPASGHYMRIDLGVGDRDGAAATTEEFDWAGLTSSFNNPSGWKDVKLVVDATPPSAPTNPTATAISSSQINLSWTASASSDVNAYRIYRGTTGALTLLTTVSGTTYQNTGLTSGTTYKYQISAVDAAGNESPRTAEKSATTQSSGGGIPYGLWGIAPDTLASGTIWTGGTLSSKSPSFVLEQLAAAEQKSPRIGMWFTMTGGLETVFRIEPGGAFNLQAWKDTLDRAHGGTIQPDGTSSYYAAYRPYMGGAFQGIVLLDDLSGFNPDVSFADIEAMAAHAKKRFPLITTAVRERATVLETTSGGAQYLKLDAGWAQFRSDRKPASTFRDANILAAQRLGIGLIMGMNIRKGYYPPGGPGQQAMPADSILAWAGELLAPGTSDYACGFYMWDSGYSGLSSPHFTTLANKAKNHVAAPCKR